MTNFWETIHFDDQNQDHQKALERLQKVPEDKRTEWIVAAINSFSARNAVEEIIANMLDDRLEKHHEKIGVLIENAVIKENIIENSQEMPRKEQKIKIAEDECNKLPDNALDFLDSL